MDNNRLAEIEARAKAATRHTWVSVEGVKQITRQDIPDLIAALREAWEDNETLLREHNHALAAIREAS